MRREETHHDEMSERHQPSLRRGRRGLSRLTTILEAPAGESISEIAYRFGFDHLGHGSASFHECFSELPSETMRGGNGSGQSSAFKHWLWRFICYRVLRLSAPPPASSRSLLLAWGSRLPCLRRRPLQPVRVATPSRLNRRSVWVRTYGASVVARRVR